MPTFAQTLLVASAALSTFAAATPIVPTKQSAGTSFSVHQVRNPHHTRNGQRALARAYRKYRKPVPEALIQALASDLLLSPRQEGGETGSAVAIPEENDIEYLTPVQIGSPPQTLNLDFDTGSSDLWVFSSALTASEQRGHAVYDPAQSNSSEELRGASWEIQYGDGSGASGSVYTDVVSIGGVEFTGQAVEIADTISQQFTEDTNNDGLVGLAFSSINTVTPRPQKTFFDNVKADLKEPLFAADLRHDEPGSYDFGFTDTARFTGEIAYTDVDTSQGFWEFTASGYQVGDGQRTDKALTGIADTGTTLLMLPDAVVKAYYKQVQGAEDSSAEGGWLFPCDADLPSFTYVVGDGSAEKEIVIPGDVINYAPVTEGASDCFGGLQSSQGLGINIFGDVALKAAYVVFKDDGSSKPQVGFASKKTS